MLECGVLERGGHRCEVVSGDALLTEDVAIIAVGDVIAARKDGAAGISGFGMGYSANGSEPASFGPFCEIDRNISAWRGSGGNADVLSGFPTFERAVFSVLTKRLVTVFGERSVNLEKVSVMSLIR